jgi:hypothetical protein
MAKDLATSQFRKNFIKRTQQARVNAQFFQAGIALLLQTDQGTYKQYETRSVLPHVLIPAFCTLTGISIHWLFTGTEREHVKTRPKDNPNPIAIRHARIAKLIP